MPFHLHHVVFSRPLEIVEHATPGEVYFTVAGEGEFELLRPGALWRNVYALIRHKTRIDNAVPEPPTPPGGIDDPGGWRPPVGHPRPLHNGVVVTNDPIPLDLKLYMPDGKLFTADQVTVADIFRFRDARGWPTGRWRYTVSGRSRTYTLNAAISESATIHAGLAEFVINEEVKSESAEPLVSAAVDSSRQSFEFDLYREGVFVAEITQAPGTRWRGTLALHDPDGDRVGASGDTTLRCDIPLAALGKSRDAQGKVRKWSLRVSPSGGVVAGSPRVTATVLAQGRIATAALTSRLETVFGVGAEGIRLEGVSKPGEVQAELTVSNKAAAEVLDMFGLLDKLLGEAGQPRDVASDRPIVVYRRDRELDYGLRLDASDFRLKAVKLSLVSGGRLGAGIPALRVRLETEGEIKVGTEDVVLARVRVRGGAAEIEVGLAIEDGVPRLVHWVPDDLIDADLSSPGTILALFTPVVGPLALAYLEHLESDYNGDFYYALEALVSNYNIAPQVLILLFGGHFTYRSIRVEGNDLVFEYVAPEEPDPRPRKTYHEAIGRPVRIEGPNAVRFTGDLGDTWAADKLREKIRHIVVVMMENRSYDHVLGYRTLTENDGARGLTRDLIDAVKAGPGGHLIRPLKQASFDSNSAGKKTRIPKGVGHELDDVAQQLSVKVPGPGGVQINGGEGFADNFREKKLSDPTDLEGCVPEDALGYYEGDDLPIYEYLARNYAYCDAFYCSHPGPTLPNRMYSLTGDVQYDRYGAPILRNNHGDNFVLSRARSIYDVLTQKGISWRVYESYPSVTMLRMFARHATNTEDIRNIEAFEADARAGTLPAFSYVEPAMHHQPQDDDHPDADMWRGQQFIQRVYTALRSNQDAWRNTLLIITYDEHGGLYDHVIPPLAEVVTPLRLMQPAVEERLAGILAEERGERGERGERFGSRFGEVGERAEERSPGRDRPEPSPASVPVQIPYGVRVPTFVVSPWTVPGKGPDVCLDHCSILKTVLATFLGEGQAFLSERVAASHTFESFLTGAEPRFPPAPGVLQRVEDRDQPPVPPRGTRIVTEELTRRRMREEGVDFHDLSGFIARLIGR